jgi:GAF domain-containing protein
VDVRERIITILLGIAITLGALAFIAAAIPAYRNNQYGALAAYVACYGWILIVALQRRRFSYAIKAFTLSFMFYILGLINLAHSGLSADAGIFLLSFTVVTSLMLGGRSGLFALILSIVTYSIVGALTVSEIFIPPVLPDNRVLLDWVSGGAVLVLLSSILALSLNTILRGLNDNITKGKLLVIDVDREREQIRLRNQDLQRRLAQLRVSAEIEHTISAVLAPKDLMQKVVDLLGDRFGLYHVGIFTLDQSSSSQVKSSQEIVFPNDAEPTAFTRTNYQLTLQAGTSKLIPDGYKLALSGSSNVVWVLANRKPRAVEVTTKTHELTNLYLPMARTELALPFLSQDRPIGIIMIHSTQTDAFDAEDVDLFQNSANSLAIALENSRIFKQNQDDLEKIRSLQKQYMRRAWADAERVRGKLSFTYEAVPTNLSDREQQPDPESMVQNQLHEPVISTYSTPISLHDQPIGEIILEAEKTAWTSEDRSFIESVITEAALALENARLLDETQRRADHDRLVADITRQVQASTDIETILSSAVRELGRKLQASEAVITLNTVAVGEDQEPTESQEVTV